MEEWKTIRLGDACKSNSSTYSTKENWDFVNYLDTGNITENTIDSIQYIDLSSETLPSRAKRKVKYNSIIYSTVRPNQRHFGIIKSQPENFLVSTGFSVIDVSPEILDADYTYYLLTQSAIVESLHAIAEQSTSAYPSIKSSDIEDLEITIPPLDTQRRIANALRCLDLKVANNNKINQNLIEQVGSLFEQQFGRFFGEDIIPDGWRVTEISALDVLVTDYVANGSFKSLADNVEYLDSETDNVLIRLTDYNSNFNSDMVHISDSAYEFLSKSKLFGDEIIISNVGANVGTVFRCPRLSKRMSLGPNAIMIRSQLYEHYLFQLFTSRYGQHLLQSIVTGSAQPKFNKTNFRSLKVLIPDRDTLESFNDAYSPINEMIVQNNLQNRSLSSLRDSLLPKLMSGELDVTEIEL